jgi:hypothetical protein
MRLHALIVVALAACGGNKSSTPSGPTPVASGACEKGGCSGTSCSEPGQEMMTTCEYKPEYACYQSAACERQTDGKCGWTQSAELVACLANPPPSAGPPETPPTPTSPTPTAGVAPNPM